MLNRDEFIANLILLGFKEEHSEPETIHYIHPKKIKIYLYNSNEMYSYFQIWVDENKHAGFTSYHVALKFIIRNLRENK